jgi:hypothetical protein
MSDLQAHQRRRKIGKIPEDPSDTQLHAPSGGARRTIRVGIGREGPYSDIGM